MSEEYDGPAQACPFCQKNMELKCIDEGKMAVFWCPNCGTIWEGEYLGETLGEGTFTAPKQFIEHT